MYDHRQWQHLCQAVKKGLCNSSGAYAMIQKLMLRIILIPCRALCDCLQVTGAFILYNPHELGPPCNSKTEMTPSIFSQGAPHQSSFHPPSFPFLFGLSAPSPASTVNWVLVFNVRTGILLGQSGMSLEYSRELLPCLCGTQIAMRHPGGWRHSNLLFSALFV